MYAKVTDTTVDTFPYTLRLLKQDNPNVSFPSSLTISYFADYGVVLVTQQADPAFDAATEYLVQGVPVFNSPNWEVTRVVTAMTQQEENDHTARTDRQADIAAMKADAEVLALLRARPNQIDTYIENNVTDLDSAKNVLKIFGRALAVLAYTTIN